jgi:DsbC/DsbD-like thiol-disulfide interchange protein
MRMFAPLRPQDLARRAAVLSAALLLAPLALVAMGSGAAPDPVEHSTDHLIVAAYPLESTVVPGKSVTIRLEIHPKPGHRIYAPGQPGYVGVGFGVAPDGVVTSAKTELPEPTEFVFVPTGERSFGFDRPFRMDAVVSIAGTREARDRIAKNGGRVSIAGQFQYQACDDVLCYRPVRIPMAFSIEAARAAAAPKK